MTRDSVRRALRTAIVSSLVLFIPGLLGWLNMVTQWARDEGATPFPDAHGLAYLGVSAIVGGIIGLVQWVLNVIEDGVGKGFLRDVPARNPGEGGAIERQYILLIIAVLVVLALVVAFSSR